MAGRRLGWAMISATKLVSAMVVWRSSPGGEQLGSQRVLSAKGLVGHHGDIVVARRGDRGDDTAALEGTQDTFAGPRDALFRVLLAWSGAWRYGRAHAEG